MTPPDVFIERFIFADDQMNSRRDSTIDVILANNHPFIQYIAIHKKLKRNKYLNV